MVICIVNTTFTVTETPPRRDSAKCQLLRLHFQFSFIKILKALQVLIFTTFWRNVFKTSFSSIFFKICFYILVSSISTIGGHADM